MFPPRKAQARAKKRGLNGQDELDWRKTVRRELSRAERLFVLGMGSDERGDDATGSICVRLLKRELERKKQGSEGAAAKSRPERTASKKARPLELEVHDAGAAPENATGLIRRFRPTHVLIIDVALGGNRPGTIFVIDKEKIAHEDISTHRLPLVHLVRYLEEDIGCRVILVGIEPKASAWREPVSTEVKAAAVRLSAWLAEALIPRLAWAKPETSGMR